MRRPLWAVIALPLGLACAACVSRVSGARTQFSGDLTCPEDRVAVSPRVAVAIPLEPPPDVAADPERRWMWEDKNAARRNAESEKTYFVAEGCGQSRIYHCFYCVKLPGKTSCGTVPNCVEDRACHELEGQPGYIACDRG